MRSTFSFVKNINSVLSQKGTTAIQVSSQSTAQGEFQKGMNLLVMKFILFSLVFIARAKICRKTVLNLPQEYNILAYLISCLEPNLSKFPTKLVKKSYRANQNMGSKYQWWFWKYVMLHGEGGKWLKLIKEQNRRKVKLFWNRFFFFLILWVSSSVVAKITGR